MTFTICVGSTKRFERYRPSAPNNTGRVSRVRTERHTCGVVGRQVM